MHSHNSGNPTTKFAQLKPVNHCIIDTGTAAFHPSHFTSHLGCRVRCMPRLRGPIEGGVDLPPFVADRNEWWWGHEKGSPRASCLI